MMKKLESKNLWAKKWIVALIILVVVRTIDTVAYAEETSFAGNSEAYMSRVKEVFEDVPAYEADTFMAKEWNVVDFCNTLDMDTTASELKDLSVAYYSDIDGDEWFSNNLALASAVGLFKGYEMGDFAANNELSVEQFIAVVVRASGYNLENGVDHWSDTFIEKALELGLIEEGDFNSYTKGITREQMAKIIVAFLELNYGELEADPVVMDSIYGIIRDSYKIGEEYVDAVCLAYNAGILGGYSDGTYNPQGTLTRAEATAVVARLIQESQRLVVDLEAAYAALNEDVVEKYRGGSAFVEPTSMTTADRLAYDMSNVSDGIKLDATDLELFIGRAEDLDCNEYTFFYPDYNWDGVTYDGSAFFLRETFKDDIYYMVASRFDEQAADVVWNYLKDYHTKADKLTYRDVVYVDRESYYILHIQNKYFETEGILSTINGLSFAFYKMKDQASFDKRLFSLKLLAEPDDTSDPFYRTLHYLN